MTLAQSGFLLIDGADLEYRMIGPAPDAAPTIVMLHEGLGSVGLWNDFPEKLQAATGCGVFAYSRAGYGASSPVTLPRPLEYMHIEASDVLPKVLDAIGFGRGLLLGHSDGASIAAIYAGSRQDHRVKHRWQRVAGLNVHVVERTRQCHRAGGAVPGARVSEHAAARCCLQLFRKVAPQPDRA